MTLFLYWLAAVAVFVFGWQCGDRAAHFRHAKAEEAEAKQLRGYWDICDLVDRMASRRAEWQRDPDGNAVAKQ